LKRADLYRRFDDDVGAGVGDVVGDLLGAILWASATTSRDLQVKLIERAWRSQIAPMIKRCVT